jgi:hypothetical protein
MDRQSNKHNIHEKKDEEKKASIKLAVMLSGRERMMLLEDQ